MSVLNPDVRDTSRLDDYRREEIALGYALRELRWVSRVPGQPSPTEEEQEEGRARALRVLTAFDSQRVG